MRPWKYPMPFNNWKLWFFGYCSLSDVQRCLGLIYSQGCWDHYMHLETLLCCQAQCRETESGFNCQAGAILRRATVQWRRELQTNVSRWNCFSVFVETATVCILYLKASMTKSLLCLWLCSTQNTGEIAESPGPPTITLINSSKKCD